MNTTANINPDTAQSLSQVSVPQRQSIKSQSISILQDSDIGHFSLLTKKEYLSHCNQSGVLSQLNVFWVI